MEPAPEGLHGVQHLLGDGGFSGRLSADGPWDGRAPLPGRRLPADDEQQQVGDDRQGGGRAVGGESAQRRLRLRQVQPGTQDGQFPFVGAAEIGHHPGRQLGGIEAGQQAAPLVRVLGELPQQLKGPVPYRAQPGLDRA